MLQLKKTLVRLAAVAIVTLVLAGSAGAHIRVSEPNGGEVLEAGSVVTISWSIIISHNTQNWDLWYSTTGNFGPWIAIAVDLPPGDITVNSVHTFDWTVPETLSSQCRVRVRMDNTGTDYEDTSDADFSIVAAPLEVAPDSFLVTRGNYVSGGVAELVASDNADLSLQRSASDVQSRTEFEVKAFSPFQNPTSLEVTLEGAVFARLPVNQNIELFDYVAGQWELLDTRAATRITDSTVTVAATGDLSRFVETGTLCMEARIRYHSPSRRQRFSSNTDQFVWTIGQ